MNAFREAQCPEGHGFVWLTGTSFVCPVCKHVMQPGKEKAHISLTPREREVVALVGEGLTNKEIAIEQVIQECTVETHLHTIFRKLGLKSRTQVARYAWEHGIRRQKQQE